MNFELAEYLIMTDLLWPENKLRPKRNNLYVLNSKWSN